jgi:hypothetical protein
MRAVLATLLLTTVGCIAAEPGQDKDTETAQRKACSDLEGLTFQGGLGNSQLVAFVADDAEYSTYTETAADGTQSIGLAQCISAGFTNVIYLDGTADHWSARADLTNTAGGMVLQWTDGQTLVAPLADR